MEIILPGSTSSFKLIQQQALSSLNC